MSDRSIAVDDGGTSGSTNSEDTADRIRRQRYVQQSQHAVEQAVQQVEQS